MEKILYIFLCMILVVSLAYAYSGEVRTNISLNITNSSINLRNDKINELIEVNLSNQTTLIKSYNWNVGYEYNFIGQNVTIITYNCSSNECSAYENDFEEIKAKLENLRQNYTGGFGEKYYNLYLDCFTNLTLCTEYRKNNEEFKSKYESCSSEIESYDFEKRKCIADYYLLNGTYTQCIVNRDNYKSQRIIFPFIFSFVGIGVGWFIFVYLKDKKKAGKAPTRKEKLPPMDYRPSIYEVKSKDEDLKENPKTNLEEGGN